MRREGEGEGEGEGGLTESDFEWRDGEWKTEATESD